MSKVVTIINETGIHTRLQFSNSKKAKEYKEHEHKFSYHINDKEVKADSLVKNTIFRTKKMLK